MASRAPEEDLDAWKQRRPSILLFPDDGDAARSKAAAAAAAAEGEHDGSVRWLTPCGMGSGWLLGHRVTSCGSCFFVSSTCVSRALLCAFYVGEGGGAGPDRAFRSKIKPKTRSEATKGRPGAGAGGAGAELSGVTRTRQGTVQTTGVPPLAGLGGRACFVAQCPYLFHCGCGCRMRLFFPTPWVLPTPWALLPGAPLTHTHTHVTPKHTYTHTTVGACIRSPTRTRITPKNT